MKPRRLALAGSFCIPCSCLTAGSARLANKADGIMPLFKLYLESNSVGSVRRKIYPILTQCRVSTRLASQIISFIFANSPPNFEQHFAVSSLQIRSLFAWFIYFLYSPYICIIFILLTLCSARAVRTMRGLCV